MHCSDFSQRSASRLAFGDGLFETMLYSKGKIPLWCQHRKRLLTSMHRLGMFVDEDFLEKSKHKYLMTLANKTAVVKLLVIRNAQGGEITNSSAVELRWSTRALKKRSISKLGVLKNALAPLPKLAGIKHVNRLPYVLAAQEMVKNGWDEALLCSTTGSLIESIHFNLWCFIDNTWLTPDLKNCGVAGVARDCILKTSSTLKVATILAEELSSVRSIALSNAVYGVVVPDFLNAVPIDKKPAEKLQKLWGEIMSDAQ